jgi:hypothetical protein
VLTVPEHDVTGRQRHADYGANARQGGEAPEHSL